MADVELRGVAKRFGAVNVINGVDLRIGDGEFVVFVGPSGCGKSTLLRLLAGLETPTDGEIRIGGEDVTDLPPKERGIAMVFQSYALYPHMTVRRNIEFGLHRDKLGKAEVARRVEAAAAKLELTLLLDRLPKALSGGQRQRVAIGRAIVREPQVFLFDEPLSNLDATLRVQMRLEIARLHRDLGTTMVYVTHDQVEAMTLADRIVVLRQGRIEQVGPPQVLYDQPANLFVAGFIGSVRMNFLRGTVAATSERGVQVALEGGPTAWLDAQAPSVLVGQAVTLGIRPEHLSMPDTIGDLASAQGLRGEWAAPVDLPGQLELVEALGDATLVHLTGPGGQPICARGATSVSQQPGTSMTLSAPAGLWHVFDGEGQALPRLR